MRRFFCVSRISTKLKWELSRTPQRGYFTTQGTPTIKHRRAGTLALPCRQYHRTTRLSLRDCWTVPSVNTGRRCPQITGIKCHLNAGRQVPHPPV